METDTGDRILTTPMPSPAREGRAAPTPWILFPPAGGTPDMIAPLAVTAPEDVAVSVVHYPRRGTRRETPMPSTLRQLAEECARHVVLTGQAGRTVVAGFSMGGLLALETARALARAGSGPALLLVVGATAPHRRVPSAERPDQAGLEALLDESGRLRDPDLRAHAKRLLCMDLALLTAHPVERPRPLRCPVAAVVGADDPLHDGTRPTGSWRAWTTREFTGRTVPGGHLGLLDPARACEFWSLAAELRALLRLERSARRLAVHGRAR
ncbi:thioesterase II family protein (plasmid) [Streptomyces sp. BI20]|uniref:thioesterase II family protein n=1 Tax=Streptomyces sp. BI20 TaxID=3403460 RepID=UPI003C747231